MPKNNKSQKYTVILLIFILKTIMLLPTFIRLRLAWIIGALSYRWAKRNKRIIQTNLTLCYPELSSKKIDQLIKAVMHEDSKLILEAPLAWFAKKSKVDRLITQVNQPQLIIDNRERNKPLVITVPHIGNWEFFWHYLQLNYSTVGMYSPVKNKRFDQVIFNARKKFGGQPFATDKKGLMGLFRAVKQGKILMILPDQVPQQGSGIYTPFFGHSAYTMTLIHNFVHKAKAELLFGSCLRNSAGNGFEINLTLPDYNYKTSDVAEFNLGMNQQVEKMIRQTPEQYQWAYKRFKKQPDGVKFYL